MGSHNLLMMNTIPFDIDNIAVLGTAVVNATDGSTLKSSGELVSDLNSVRKLSKILLDTGTILGNEPLRRITGQ